MQTLEKRSGTQWCPSILTPIAASYVLVEVVFRRINKHFDNALPPNLITSALCIILGVFFYYMEPFGEDYQGLSYIPPEDVLHAFIPLYTICTLYQTDLFLYIKTLRAVCVLCTVVLIGTGAILYAILKFIVHPEWDVIETMLATTVILPVQPVHAIVLFNELKKYRNVATILELELLGSFTVIFVIFEFTRIVSVPHFWSTIVKIVIYIIGGVIFGVISGKMSWCITGTLYDDSHGALMAIIGFTALIYALCTYILNLSGNIAIIIFSSQLAFSRHQFEINVDKSITNFFQVLKITVDVSVLCLCITESIPHILSFNNDSSICASLILYVNLNVVRFIMFVLFRKIIQHSRVLPLEYDLRTGLILGLSGQKGSLNFLLTFMLLVNPATFALARVLLAEVTLIFIYSMIGNALPLKHLLKILEFTEFSSLRRQNMNVCLKLIMKSKNIIMRTLKTSHFLGDANWEVIRSETEIKHPYTKQYINEYNIDDGSEIDELFHTASASCPDCKRKIPYDLTNKDISDLCREARNALLKSKKVSVNKQFESGIINMSCQQLLLYNIDMLLDENNVHRKMDIESYLRPGSIITFLRNCFEAIKGKRKLVPRNSFIRRLCYYTVHHVVYDLVMMIPIVVYTVFAIMNFNDILDPRLAGVHSILIAIFTIDLFLRIIAWSRFHDAEEACWMTWCVIFLITEITLLCLSQSMPGAAVKLNIARAFRVITILRLTYLYIARKSIATVIIYFLNRKIDENVTFGFEVAGALAFCCDETLDSLSQILDVKLIRDVYTRDLQVERKFLTDEMRRIQKERPWIAITVKTKQVIRSTLFSLSEGLKELQQSGYVDSIEHDYISRLMADKFKVMRSLRMIKTANAKVMFYEIPWLCGNVELSDYLYDKVKKVKLAPTEVVIRDGHVAYGVYVVLSGSLKLHYKAKSAKLKEFAERGLVPIVDYLSTTDFNEDFEDDLMPGSTFGEKSILTRRKYNCTIVADTCVEAYLLSSDALQEAFKIYNNPVTGLEAKMWKYSNINLALSIMSESSLYKTLNQKRIKFKLDRAFVPSIRCYKEFVVTESIEDIILIEGFAMDCIRKRMFYAPALITKNTHNLYVSKSEMLGSDLKNDTKFMIVPAPGNSEEEVMIRQEEQAVIGSYTSKCILHTVQEMKLIQKQKKMKSIS